MTATGVHLTRLAELYDVHRWPLEPDWLLRRRVMRKHRRIEAEARDRYERMSYRERVEHWRRVFWRKP